MKKTVKVYMDEESYSIAKDYADQKSMSLSSLICSTLMNELKHPDADLCHAVDENETCTIRLYGQAASMLRSRAQRAGVTPTAYIRDIILFQNLTNIKIEASLGREILAAVNDYDLDLQFIMHKYLSASSPDCRSLCEDILSNQRQLINEVLKYQKTLTGGLSKLKHLIIKKLAEDN